MDGWNVWQVRGRPLDGTPRAHGMHLLPPPRLQYDICTVAVARGTHSGKGMQEEREEEEEEIEVPETPKKKVAAKKKTVVKEEAIEEEEEAPKKKRVVKKKA